MGDLQLLQDLLLLGSATEQFKITDQRLELVPVLLMPDPMALEWLWVSEVPSILRSEPTLSVKEPQLLSWNPIALLSSPRLTIIITMMIIILIILIITTIMMMIKNNKKKRNPSKKKKKKKKKKS